MNLKEDDSIRKDCTKLVDGVCDEGILGNPSKCSLFTGVQAISEKQGEKQPQSDTVNHPKHYLMGGREAIDVIKDILTPDEFMGFCKGNVIKYISRAGFKGTPAKDFQKAAWYASFIAEILGGNSGDERIAEITV